MCNIACYVTKNISPGFYQRVNAFLKLYLYDIQVLKTSVCVSIMFQIKKVITAGLIIHLRYLEY